jgi:hypothetical protein
MLGVSTLIPSFMVRFMDLIRPTTACVAYDNYSLKAGLWRSLLVGILSLLPIAIGLLTLRWCGGANVDVFTVPNWGIRNPTLNYTIGITDALFLSPLVETALMLVPIRLCQKAGIADSRTPVISAIIWAIVHARSGNLFRLIAAWPFYLFSLQFMREERKSVNHAWFFVTASHSIYNTLAFLFNLFFGSA